MGKVSVNLSELINFYFPLTSSIDFEEVLQITEVHLVSHQTYMMELFAKISCFIPPENTQKPKVFYIN